MTLRTERVRTLDQVRAFVEGSEAVDPRFLGSSAASQAGPSSTAILKSFLCRADDVRIKGTSQNPAQASGPFRNSLNLMSQRDHDGNLKAISRTSLKERSDPDNP